MGFKRVLLNNLPKSWLSAYHFVLGYFSRAMYGNPSEKLYVIGITGTSGKSTTSYILKHILNSCDKKCGALSTIEFDDGGAGGAKINNKKMTMLGRGFIQSYLKKMVGNGCKYAIVETTSEGVLQHRHKFINYDMAVFTNLYKEHIEAHGGFENYKSAKLEFFKHVATSPKKNNIGKTAVVSGESIHTQDFLNFPFDRKIVAGREGKFENHNAKEIFIAKNIIYNSGGFSFTLNEQKIEVPMLGRHNVLNALLAATCAHSVGASLHDIAFALKTLPQVPGRLETINEGQNFLAMVDYAFEPKAMAALYDVVEDLKREGIIHGRVLHVLGATGGGRDKDRRFLLGNFVGERADFVFATNEDPYDDDPEEIIKEVYKGAYEAGKILNRDVWKILDRGEAILKAVEMAGAGDIILLTGKGSEQSMVVAGGRRIPWDDRKYFRQAIRERFKNFDKTKVK